MDLRAAVIVLGPPCPRTKVRRAVGSLDVVDQVLDQGDLLHGVDDLQAAGDHLDEVHQVQGHTVQLRGARLKVGSGARPHILCIHLQVVVLGGGEDLLAGV